MTSSRAVGLLLAAASILATPIESRAQSTRVLEGVVIDSLMTRRPIPSAKVVLLGTDRSETTDSRGRFVFRGLEPGSYTVAFWSTWLDSLGLPVLHLTVDVPTRSGAAALIVPTLTDYQRMMCRTPLAADMGILIGEVRDVQGAPQDAAVVGAHWEETSLGPGVFNRVPRTVSAETALSGWYVLCGVPRGGGRTLSVTAPGAADTVVVDVDVVAAVQRRDVIAGDTSSRVVISGRVESAPGKPVGEASVGLLRGASGTTRPNADGAFTLSVPKRSAQLIIRSLGFVPLVIDIDPVSDSTDLGSLRLERLPPLLAEVTVSGRAVTREELEFETRRAQGMGEFIDAETLGRAARITSGFVSSKAYILLLRPGGHNQQKLMMMRGAGPCDPRFYIDGHDNGSLDVLEQAFWLERAKRIEAYRAAFAPPKFADFGGCGSVVIWTW